MTNTTVFICAYIAYWIGLLYVGYLLNVFLLTLALTIFGIFTGIILHKLSQKKNMKDG